MHYILLIIVTLLLTTACGGETSNQAIKDGYLDSPVEGLSYSSSSGITGITDSNGRFEYEMGDTVTFSLPPFILGSTQGASRVTVLDIANSPQPTQTELDTYSSNNSYSNKEIPTVSKGLNLAVLFQSLDEDSNPQNGVQITAKTRSQLNTVTLPLAFNNFSHKFYSQLLKVLTQAELENKFDLGIFSVSTIRNLVTEGIIKTKFFVLEYTESGANGDTELSRYITNSYDTNGNQIKIETDENNDGAMDTITAIYDAKDRIIYQEIDFSNNGIPNHIETHKFLTKNNTLRSTDSNGDGIADSTSATTFNDQGMRTFREDDNDANGTIDHYSQTHYDKYGNNILIESYNSSGIITSILSTLYSSPITMASLNYKIYSEQDGSLKRNMLNIYNQNNDFIQRLVDNDGDGINDASINLTYSTPNCLATLISSSQLPGESSYKTISIYDSSCNLTKSMDLVNNGSPDRIRSYSYDSNGNMTRFENDYDGNGNPDFTHYTEYDNHNNIIRTQSEEDFDDNGTIETRITTYKHTYDSHGNLTRTEEYSGNDDTASWIKTYAYIEVSNYHQEIPTYYYNNLQ